VRASERTISGKAAVLFIPVLDIKKKVAAPGGSTKEARQGGKKESMR